MALFQNAVIKKYLQAQNKEQLKEKWLQFQQHFHNPTIQENIRNSKEEQYQGEFLIDLFVRILGYTKNPQPNFNLTTEYKNVKDSKKADGAILIDDKVLSVIELKGTNTTDLGKIETQAFGYKNNQPDCIYIITSNFEKIRFYIDNAIEYLEFNLFQLQPSEFELLYLCLAHENLSKGIAKSIKEESVSQEDVITKKLYKDYSLFKRELYHNLVALNPDYEPIELFKKSQKLLDRFLFIFFAEDRNLLPTNLIFRINKEWQNLRLMRIEVSLYERYKVYFNDLNSGAKVVLPAFSETASKQIEEHQIFAYNGGLFKVDEILDNIKVDDSVLFKHTENLSNYDFASEIDVNILGHIFENSLNELDEIRAELDGEVIDETKTKRKKDGVFYTPKYITKYIVDNTIGKLCNEKKIKLQLNEEDYTTDKKRQKKTLQGLIDKLQLYRNWLLQLTICDPACGSGAFLNQALDFLIEEHKYIDELQAKLFGDTFILSDVENSILENNLFGVDLNEESVEIAKLSLWLRTAQPNRKLNDLSGNIKCGNSLIDDLEIAGEKAFNWQQEFPQVFAKGGFDVIIGNPPYGALIDKKTQVFLNNKYINGASETVISFLKLSMDLLKDKGFFSFIIPKSFTYASNYKAIRDYLINDLIEIVDCKKVWSEVKLEQTIFNISKSSNKDFYSSIVLNGTEFIESSKILKNDSKKFGFLVNGISLDELKIGLKLFEKKFFLNDISTNQRGGSFQKIITEKGLIKVIAGVNVQKSGITSFKGFINDESLLNDKRVVISENSILVQNIVSHINNPVEHIKIISCVPNKEYIGNTIILDTVNQIVVEGDISSIYINELLNSKIVNWYLYRFVFGKAIRTMHFDNAVTSRIPIPKNISNEDIFEVIKHSTSKNNLIKEIEKKRIEFLYYLKQVYFENQVLSKKLEGWDKLNFKQFLKEVKENNCVKIDSNDEYKLALLFKNNSEEINKIVNDMLLINVKIDTLLSSFYEISESEKQIINLQMP